MRARVVLPVLSAFAIVVATAVVITAVRSEAKGISASSAGPSTAGTSVAVSGFPASQGSIVTVPPLSTSAAPTASDTAAPDSAALERAAASIAAAARSAASASRATASNAAVASSAAVSSAAASASSSAAAAAAAASSSSSSAAASFSAAAVAAADAPPAPDTSDAVQASVQEAAEAGITQSVVVMDRQTGSVTTSFNAGIDVPAMSLVKLFLAADVIDTAGGVSNVDSGTLDQLHQMIVASDDSIAQDFYDDDGGGAIITRMANRYGLRATSPSPDPEYWGDVQITAHDQASFLYQLLDDPETSTWFTEAMEGSLDTGADGFDQNFGVNAVPGSGSKQGWGCCLGGVMSIHSMGFTSNQIIVVLSTEANDVDFSELGTAQQLTDDPGAQASVAAVTRTVQAALPPS